MRSRNTNSPVPATPVLMITLWSPEISAWTWGQMRADAAASGIMAANETMYTNVEPEKVPSHSGSSTSKNLLCRAMTTPEMMSAPIMPMSSVFMPATMARPEARPTSAV